MKHGLLYVLLASFFGAFISTLAGHADIQRSLRTGTTEALAADVAMAEILGKVEIKFRGQEAFVSGEVGSRADLVRLEEGLREAAIPARFGRALSAVTRVHHDAVAVGNPAP